MHAVAAFYTLIAILCSSHEVRTCDAVEHAQFRTYSACVWRMQDLRAFDPDVIAVCIDPGAFTEQEMAE